MEYELKPEVMTAAMLKAAELMSEVPEEKREIVAITINSFVDGLLAGMNLKKKAAG